MKKVHCITIACVVALWGTQLQAKSVENNGYKVVKHKNIQSKKGVLSALNLYPTTKYDAKMLQTAMSLVTLATIHENRIPTGETESVKVYEDGRFVGYEDKPIMKAEVPLKDLYKKRGYHLEIFKSREMEVYALNKGNNVALIYKSYTSSPNFDPKKIGKSLGINELKKLKTDRYAIASFEFYKKQLDRYLKRFRGKNIYVVSYSENIYSDATPLTALTALYIHHVYSKKTFYYAFNSERAGYKDFYKVFESKIKGSFHISTLNDDKYNVPASKKKKKWNHVGQLLRLDLNGKRVPLQKIQNRRVVKSDISILAVLQKHFQRCATQQCYKRNILIQAANKEREGRK